MKELALGPDAAGRKSDSELAGAAGDRDRDSGSAADRAQFAPPGGVGPRGDTLADGPRSRPAGGLARDSDRDHPRALAGDRRNRPIADGGGRRFDRCASSFSFDRYTVLPVEIYNYAKNPKVQFQTVTAGGS